MDKFSKIMESKGKPIKIGLDFHGVIDAMPDFFSFFADAIIKAGGEIHILTGGLTNDDKQLLEKHKIKYTHFFSIIDYHKEKGTPTSGTHPKYGFPMISDEEWDKTKADYCRREGIDISMIQQLIMIILLLHFVDYGHITIIQKAMLKILVTYYKYLKNEDKRWYSYSVQE
jgi:hypothetical protein